MTSSTPARQLNVPHNIPGYVFAGLLVFHLLDMHASPSTVHWFVSKFDAMQRERQLQAPYLWHIPGTSFRYALPLNSTFILALCCQSCISLWRLCLRQWCGSHLGCLMSTDRFSATIDDTTFYTEALISNQVRKIDEESHVCEMMGFKKVHCERSLLGQNSNLSATQFACWESCTASKIWWHINPSTNGKICSCTSVSWQLHFDNLSWNQVRGY